MTRHNAYGGDTPLHYEGTRNDMTGGEYLGSTARPDLMLPGDIITSTYGIEKEFINAYWYDPQLLITGLNSYVRKDPNESNDATWVKINR